ncbi:hypothetical protein LINGRAHAP2_LOCUS24887, partial [Linum grandiflorum]
MKIEEANRLKDKTSNSTTTTMKANLIESKTTGDYKTKDSTTKKKPSWQMKKQTSFKRTGVTQKSQKGACYVCGKMGHKAFQCLMRKDTDHRGGGGYKPGANLVESEDTEVIAAVVTEINMIENHSEWILDS